MTYVLFDGAGNVLSYCLGAEPTITQALAHLADKYGFDDVAHFAEMNPNLSVSIAPLQ